MTQQNRDPYWLPNGAKFHSTCTSCRKHIRPGDDAFYYPGVRKIYCGPCGEVESASFEALAQDEELAANQSAHLDDGRAAFYEREDRYF